MRTHFATLLFALLATGCRRTPPGGPVGIATVAHDAATPPRPRTTLAAGLAHVCRVSPRGDVDCWGSNDLGQLGQPLREAIRQRATVRVSGGEAIGMLSSDRRPPARIASLRNIVSIAAGDLFTCALDTQGGVQCWGAVPLGIANATIGPRPRFPDPRTFIDATSIRSWAEPAIVALPWPAAEIAAHRDVACARSSRGEVACWGRVSETTPATDAWTVHSFDEFRGAALALAVTPGRVCALESTGTIRCVDSSAVDRPRAVHDFGPIDARRLGTTTLQGGESVCASNDASTRCFVVHEPSSLLALSSGDRLRQAMEAVATSSARAVITRDRFSCALGRDGHVRCAGVGGSGVLGSIDETAAGDGVRTPFEGVADIAGLPSASAIAAGEAFVCVADDAADTWCWGSRLHGVLGRDEPLWADVPKRVEGLTGVRAIAAGDEHVCAETDAGIRCWGRTTAGASGARVPRVLLQPAMVPAGAAAHLATPRCVIDRGALSCWRDLDTRTGPFGLQPVTLASSAVSVDDFRSDRCVVLQSGAVSCGSSDAETSTFATWIGARTRATSQVSVGRQRCAVDAAHAMRCECSRSRSPDVTAIPPSRTLANVTRVSAGDDATCAIRTNGSVTCWEACPIVGTEAAAAPPRDDVVRDAVDLSCGDGRHCCAVLRDGSLHCWGEHGVGEEIPDVAYARETATRIPRVTDAVEVSLGIGFGCVRTRGGEAWCWGRGSSGQLGDGISETDSRPEHVAAPD